jgi:hypothetical protein
MGSLLHESHLDLFEKLAETMPLQRRAPFFGESEDCQQAQQRNDYSVASCIGFVMMWPARLESTFTLPESGSCAMNQTAPASTASVDTGKVSGRRSLRFESLDAMMVEVNHLAEAERAGRLKQLGNWTLGQALGHIAQWMEYAYTPSPLNPPFFIRWFLRMRRKQYIYGQMKPGVRIPGVEGGTLGTASMSLDEGLARLQKVVDRLKRETPTEESKAFGPMTHEEAISLNLRHAELHLSFFVPA